MKRKGGMTVKARRWTMGLLAGAGLLGLILWAGAAVAQLFVTADRVTNGGIVDAVDFGNSTRTNLNSIDSFVSGDLASFTGRPFDTLGFAYTNVFVLASQQSSTNGLRFLWAADLASANFSILASTSILESGRGYSFSFTPRGRYFRVQYVNGLTKLTSFTLSVIHKGGGANDLVSIGGFSPVSFAAGALVSTMPFSASTPLLTSQTGLGSVSTGFGNTTIASIVESGWEGVPLTSFFTALTSNTLNSVLLVPGLTGTRVSVHGFSLTTSAIASILLATGDNWSGNITTHTALFSHRYGADGGAVVSPFGGMPRPFTYFSTNLGSALWLGVSCAGGTPCATRDIQVNALWSRR